MHRLFLLILPLLIAIQVSTSCIADTDVMIWSTTAQTKSKPSTTTLYVFAAASLTDAFSDIGTKFTAAYPEIDVVFSFSGSNQLATQIREGVPADVFAAADTTQMEKVIDTGRVIGDAQNIFAHNRLVVVTPRDSGRDLHTLSDLSIPGLKIVFAATEVPVGRYTLDFLENAANHDKLEISYKNDVLDNVVSYEVNVRAVLSKVLLGEADAGIVYTSDVTTQNDELQRIEIPDNLNIIANYPIAPLADSPHPELAQQFVDYVLGPEGQQILANYGFIPVDGTE